MNLKFRKLTFKKSGYLRTVKFQQLGFWNLFC